MEKSSKCTVALNQEAIDQIAKEAIAEYYRLMMPNDHRGSVDPGVALRSRAYALLHEAFDNSMLRILGLEKDHWGTRYELKRDSPLAKTLADIVREVYGDELKAIVLGLKVSLPASVKKTITRTVTEFVRSYTRELVHDRVYTLMEQQLASRIEETVNSMLQSLPVDDASKPDEQA